MYHFQLRAILLHSLHGLTATLSLHSHLLTVHTSTYTINYAQHYVEIVDFDNVTGWELNPLVTLLQTVRDEYSFTKPEVYKTIHGEKHREKVSYQA